MSEKKSTDGKQRKSVKKRNWAFVLYPESAPSDWLQQLKNSGLMGAISPLHDKDLDPTGMPKKAHYHIILVYGNTTTFNNVKSLTDSLNQPIPQALEQVRGYYRYLTHKDNPDKAQYSDSDIITFGGFDIADFVEMSKSEVTKYIKEIHQFIRDNNIVEYSDLCDMLIDAGLEELYEVSINHTLFINSYISSRRNKLQLLRAAEKSAANAE